jgi:hypothetical protein
MATGPNRASALRQTCSHAATQAGSDTEACRSGPARWRNSSDEMRLVSGCVGQDLQTSESTTTLPQFSCSSSSSPELSAGPNHRAGGNPTTSECRVSMAAQRQLVIVQDNEVLRSWPFVSYGVFLSTTSRSEYGRLLGSAAGRRQCPPDAVECCPLAALVRSPPPDTRRRTRSRTDSQPATSS